MLKPYCGNSFKIGCIISDVNKETNLTIWYSSPLNPWLFTISVKSEALFWRFSERLRDRWVIVKHHGFRFINEKSLSHPFLSKDPGKNHIKAISLALRKNIWWFRKRSLFLRFHDGGQRHVREYKWGKLIFYFSINVAKTC